MSNTTDFTANGVDDNSTPNRVDAEANSTNPFTRRQVIAGSAVLAGSVAVGIAERSQAQAPQPQKNNVNDGLASGQLQGKVAVVTGAARGIGRACALRLAREGANIVAIDIAEPTAIKSIGYALSTPEELAETQRLVRTLGRRCLSFKADTRNRNQIQQVVERAIQELGKVDILVANAGILPRISIEETTNEAWHECIEVNLTGTWNAMQAVIPHMKQRKAGRIVAIASEFARRCLAPERVVYTASKWGVMGLVKAAALELSQTGITVNAVSPGFTRTGMTQNEEVFRSVLRNDSTPTAAEAENVIRRTNIEKNALPIAFVEPDDIANAVHYLVSDDARYITGFAIDVTGGFSPQYTA